MFAGRRLAGQEGARRGRLGDEPRRSSVRHGDAKKIDRTKNRSAFCGRRLLAWVNFLWLFLVVLILFFFQQYSEEISTGKRISKMACFVSCGTLNLDQSVVVVTAGKRVCVCVCAWSVLSCQTFTLHTHYSTNLQDSWSV